MEKQTRKSKPRVDLTGKKFGRLTPQYYIKGGKWHCICSEEIAIIIKTISTCKQTTSSSIGIRCIRI